jgi:uncharacterized iron-regulated membrane protein
MDERIDAKRRKRSFLPPDFVRAMLAGHSALGLAFAALIYVVCLSGTLTVFLYEFQRWEQPNAPIVGKPLTPNVVNAAVEAGYKQAVADKSDHDIFLLAPGAMTPRLVVNYHDHEANVEGHWIADGEGRLVVRMQAPWSEFLTGLHTKLHLPSTWGLFIVGLTGVTLLSSLVSGLLAHPRIFKGAFALRWGGSKRLQEADLHNRLGVWGLPFHIAVSLTGALLGLSTLIVGVLALAAYDGDSGKAFSMLLGPRASEEETAAPLPDVGAMIRHVQSTRPDAEVVTVFVQHAAKIGQVVHLGMRTPGHLALSNAYYFKGDGTPLGDGGLETGSLGQQILGAIQPLHFGWFGGLPVKIAYGLLGLALTVVTHSGVVIWLARRRDKGRPAERWERIWAAVVWGQPFALAAAALVSLLLTEKAILPAYLACVTAALILALRLPSGEITTRVLRLASAAALGATLLVHGYIWAAHVADVMAWAVSAVLLFTVLALTARRRSKRHLAVEIGNR